MWSIVNKAGEAIEVHATRSLCERWALTMNTISQAVYGVKANSVHVEWREQS